MRDVKQVIVIRRDLKMRRGKEIAQGAHAAGAWILQSLAHLAVPDIYVVAFSEAELAWLGSGTRKITCQVPDLDALLTVVNAAKAAKVRAEVIHDAGYTEFRGIETITAAAIGPDWDDRIDPITGNLKLY